MTKRINTEKAPAAIGPYSQGVAAGNFLFVSGQLPIDPKTGSIDADNVADQARQSLTNLSQILEAAGTSMDKVVKTTVFIQHMDDFAVMNEVYAQFFQGEVLPAPQQRDCTDPVLLRRDPQGGLQAPVCGDCRYHHTGHDRQHHHGPFGSDLSL